MPNKSATVKSLYITSFQHFRAIQFSDQTKQITGAVCAHSGNGQGNGGRGNGYNQGPHDWSYGHGNQPRYGYNNLRTGGQASYGPNGIWFRPICLTLLLG